MTGLRLAGVPSTPLCSALTGFASIDPCTHLITWFRCDTSARGNNARYCLPTCVLERRN